MSWKHLANEKKETLEGKREEISVRKEVKRPEKPSFPSKITYKENPFKSIADLKKVKGFKLAVHGLSKTGKTYLGMTAPDWYCESCKTYILFLPEESGSKNKKCPYCDAENVVKAPIRVIGSEQTTIETADLFPWKNIEIKEIYNENVQEDIIDGMESLREVLSLISWLGKDFDHGTLVIDSGTDLWRWIAEWLFSYVGAPRGKTIRKMAKDKDIFRFDWRYANVKYQNIVMKLLNSDVNIILTGQDHNLYDDNGNMLSIVGPSWQKQTPFWFNIILRTYKGVSGKGQDWFVEVEGIRGADVVKLENLKLKRPDFMDIVNVYLKAKNLARSETLKKLKETTGKQREILKKLKAEEKRFEKGGKKIEN